MKNIVEQDAYNVGLSAMIIWGVYVEGIEVNPNLQEFFKFIDTKRELEGICEARGFVYDHLAGRMDKMYDDMDEQTRLEIGSFDIEYVDYWLAFVFPSLLKEKPWDAP